MAKIDSCINITFPCGFEIVYKVTMSSFIRDIKMPAIEKFGGDCPLHGKKCKKEVKK